MREFDVVIVGAGAAGLAAMEILGGHGISVCCIEARGRLGGRILTVHDAEAGLPIELGAEFVHGQPPEIWEMINRGVLAATERHTHAVYFDGGRLREDDEMDDRVEQVLSDLQATAHRRRDESFSCFLDRSFQPEAVKRWAAAYVEGFNAAPKERIGIAALAREARAAKQIGGDRLFSLLTGYDALVRALKDRVQSGVIHLNSVVERIKWQPRTAAVLARSTLTGVRETIRCRRVIVTVPIGVLGAIRFDPSPDGIPAAAGALGFGPVVRITLRFETAFWEKNPQLSRAGFVHSLEPVFPTWWKAAATEAPIITGWTAGPAAERLVGLAEAEITALAVATIERIVSVKASALRRAYYHDWQNDPFSGGAYSYVPAGQLANRDLLAQPVCHTLYFAGEATDTTGHSATVHGAIASGRRAAAQVVADIDSGQLESAGDESLLPG